MKKSNSSIKFEVLNIHQVSLLDRLLRRRKQPSVLIKLTMVTDSGTTKQHNLSLIARDTVTLGGDGLHSYD